MSAVTLPADPVVETSGVEQLLLDGNTLLPCQLLQLSSGKIKIDLTPESWDRVQKSREVIDNILKAGKVAYGINTGFGNFASTVISPDRLKELQENLIRSHAAGVGSPLSPARTRMLLALRINVLAKGHSGISVETLRQIIDAFNHSCLSWVPEKGTVGASGDLAPLSHLALGMLGEGKMWNAQTNQWDDAAKVLAQNGLKPLNLQAKEGLALINGTQLITALGAEGIERATRAALQADVVAALTLEVLKGTSMAADADIHAARPHPGQVGVAERFRALLRYGGRSEISNSHRNCGRVQDSYTLRCCPQVHGISHDTIGFARAIITTEMNSATDNPMVFAERGEVLSGGNFHGEYPAKALDYLAIGIHEIASISERRLERLVNPALSELPAFLVKEGGLNSGFMIAHCTAAALVSENKVLCHPSSVDSLSTSAAKEDHVSMGGMSARKALVVIENVETVVAIELLAACQALEFLRPLKTTPPLEAVYNLVRTVVTPYDKDRFMAPDIEAVKSLIQSGKVWEAVKDDIEAYNRGQHQAQSQDFPVATHNTPAHHHADHPHHGLQIPTWG